MKALLPLVVLLLVCIGLFSVGLFAPRRAARMQRKYDDASKEAEQKSGDNAGVIGDATQTALAKGREAADASGRAGRRINRRASGT